MAHLLESGCECAVCLFVLYYTKYHSLANWPAIMGTWGGYLQVHLNQWYFWWLCCNGSNAKTGIRCHLTFSLCIDLPKWMRKHMSIYLKFGSIEFKFKNDQPKRQNQIYESWCHPSMLSSEVNTHIGWEIDSKCIEGIRHLGCLSSDTLKWRAPFGFCFNVGKLKNNLLGEIKEGTEIILWSKRMISSMC